VLLTLIVVVAIAAVVAALYAIALCGAPEGK
jgi:hypothetical protein